MSEQRKERLVIVDGPLGAIETASGQAFAQVSQVINDPLHVKRRANTKDLVASYNACLSLPNPEADVKGMVEALQKVFDYGHGTSIEHALGSAWVDVREALARLRREPLDQKGAAQ